MIKIYLNKHNNVEKIELPTGEVDKRNYGNLPNMLILEPYEGQEFTMYNHKNEAQFEALLLEVVSKNTISYDITLRYVEEEE
jgi:hypothetical protein